VRTRTLTCQIFKHSTPCPTWIFILLA
jgi:hypothetical protein